MMLTRQTVALTFVLLLAIAGGIGVHYVGSSGTAARLSSPAPAYTLTDLDGTPHSLSSLRGKLVLVNFWATWCAPCMDELPLLAKAQEEYGRRGLQILGPAMDDEETVRPALERFGITYPVSADVDATLQALHAFGNDEGALPYSVLIGRDGHVIDHFLGGLHEDELRELLEKHLRS